MSGVRNVDGLERVATAGDQRLCGSPFERRLSSVIRLLEYPKSCDDY
jgi:hypothetical protein